MRVPLGPEAGEATGHALICTRLVGDGHCGDRATHHIIWDEDVNNSLSCAPHTEDSARRWDFVQIHPTDDSACGIPGSLWLRGEHRCVMDCLEEEPVLRSAAHAGAAS